MINPLDRLRHHVTGAIERGEKKPVVEVRPTHFAVPCVVLVEAKDEDEAYEIVNLKVQNATLGSGACVLIDEELNAFPYDADTFEVRSINDRAAAKKDLETP
jgi:hypothetical protein